MFKHNKNKRTGTRLEDGKTAHAADHQQWSRRQFLSRTGVMGGGMLFGSSLFSFASPLFSSLYDNPDNDRVLILIRLAGGNDGLNTIVPFGSNNRRSLYETARSTVGLGISELTQISPEFALPNVMADPTTGIHSLWQQNNMAVIHNVGYTNQSRSHFTGSDLWATGAVNDSSKNDLRQYTGWMGRYHDNTLPTFLETPPVIPPAIQIGTSNNLIFRGEGGTPYDMVFTDTQSIFDVIETGELYNTSDFIPSDCDDVVIQNIERAFVRRVNNNSFRYAGSIQAAWEKGDYGSPDYGDNYLAEQMSIVARLIKGKLGTKIYLVTLGGFDTHAAQKNTHLALLEKVSNAIRSTYDDLQAVGHADRVMMMTFSEFGRTVTQNDSAGTDHGTLAPVMLFGGGVNGQNFYGTPMDLSSDKVDGLGLVDYDTQDGTLDFRTIYDRVLRDWLCAGAQLSDDVLNHGVDDNAGLQRYNDTGAECSGTGTNCTDPLGGMILGGCNATVSQSATTDPQRVVFGFNFNDATGLVEFKFGLKYPANVKLTIAGNDIIEAENSYHEAGSYTYTENILPGEYLCRLEAGGTVTERTLIINQ